MNKRITLIYLLLIISVILCGCTNNATSDNSSESKVSEKLTAASDNNESDNESFDFFVAMNLSKLNSDNSTGEPLGFKYEIGDDLVSIVLETTVSPDSSIRSDKTIIVHTPFTSETNAYDKTFEYAIPSTFFKSKGMHILQAVAVPYYIPNALDNIKNNTSYGFNGSSTNKTRVVTE